MLPTWQVLCGQWRDAEALLEKLLVGQTMHI
jgi:hypothetical protein